MDLSRISTLAALQEWVLMISPIFIKRLRYLVLPLPQVMHLPFASGFLIVSATWFQGRMKEMNRNSKVPKFVRRIELVQKRSIMYYQQQKSQPFLKIVVALPTMVATCRGNIPDSFVWYLFCLGFLQ